MNTTPIISEPESAKRLTDTKEWSSDSINIIKGCIHCCSYCWANERGKRFGYKKDRDSEELRESEYKKNNRKKFEGRVMFPSTHDITPNTVRFMQIN